MVAFLKLFHHSVLVLQLQLCPLSKGEDGWSLAMSKCPQGLPCPGDEHAHPYEDLDGLGAGDTSGATGDVLGDDAEGAQGGVLATVVLGTDRTMSVRL